MDRRYNCKTNQIPLANIRNEPDIDMNDPDAIKQFGI